MKKKAFALVMITMLLAGCGQEGSTRGKMPEAEDTVEAPKAEEVKEEPTATPAEEAAPEETGEGVLWVPMSAEELEQIRGYMIDAENGFFLSDYCTPEMIDWNEVCYCGAGIGLPISDKLYDTIEAQEEDIYTDVTAISGKDLKEFVLRTTGTDYDVAQRPLTWTYLYDEDVYYSMHGDTNYQPIELTRGEANGDIYRLYYNRYDFGVDDELEYVMTAQISEDNQWMYLSNLPSDKPTQASLLSMSFYAEEDKAAMDGYAPKDYVEIPEDLSPEPEPWYWVLLFALEDDTHIALHSADISTDMGEQLVWDGIFLPGQELYQTVLDRGESVAVRVNLPWNPRIHLSVDSGNFYGEYFFGQDNWRHLWTEERPMPDMLVVGHDFVAEGRGPEPQNNIQFLRMLEGDWICFDKNGDPAAVLSYQFNPGQLVIRTGENYYELWVNMEHILVPDSAVADGISLSCYDTETLSQFPTDDYDPDALGDYLVEVSHAKGLQTITLVQANNGDGILSYLIP
ncbi:MAG: hypothetical protein J6N53_10935, partial [Lachnospiraceae bacterium]|nr:hypothetical protein [Lachnospiraceae bacterium]